MPDPPSPADPPPIGPPADDRPPESDASITRGNPLTPQSSVDTQSTLDSNPFFDPADADFGPAVGGSFGRYTILAELGAGGMGAVFKAWDPVLDRPVALKVMHGRRLASTMQVRRFLNEARAVARLGHPNVVKLHDMGQVDGCPYFTMAVVDGASLSTRLQGDPIAPETLCGMLAGIGRALAHAHRAGVIHRDVKPENILIDGDDTALLVDFGVARLLDTDLTRTGQVVGTPAFMAPEQARGDVDIDARADVFGLGTVLIRALGLPPDALPRDLRAICHTATAPDRDARYADADALADDLDRFARGEPVAAALPGIARRVGWWLHRRRAGVIAIALAILAAVSFEAVADYLDTRRATADRIHRDARARETLGQAAREASALRSQGRMAEADGIVEAAAHRLDVQGAPALFDFYLAEGRAAGDTDRAGAAFGAAFARASTPEHRHTALTALGGWHLRRGEADNLGRVLSIIADHRSDSGPGVSRLDRRHALLTGDLMRAAAATDSSEQPLKETLEALASTTSVRSAGDAPRDDPIRFTPHALDVDGDGVPEHLIGYDFVTHHPDLPPVGRLRAPPGATWFRPPRLFRGPDGSTMILGDLRAADDVRRRALLRLDDAHATPVEVLGLAWTQAGRPAIQADLDGDGLAPIWSAPPWTLAMFTPDAQGDWRRIEPDEHLRHSGSIVTGLAAPRARDGRRLLAAGVGEWRAYDVRLMAPGAKPNTLDLIGRRKLGSIRSLAVETDGAGLDWLWAVRDSRALNPRMFPPEFDPRSPRLYRLAVEPGLAVDAEVDLSWPPGTSWSNPLAFHPVPGLLAIALRTGGPNRGPGGWIVADPQGMRGGPWTFSLRDLMPIAALDLDADGDDELIVRSATTGAVRVLGSGIEPLPVPDRTRPAAEEDPSDALETLVALGQVDVARDQYRLRAQMGVRAARAWARAGALSETQGDLTGAAHDHGEAARAAAETGDEQLAIASWQNAARIRRAAHDRPGEEAALRALLAHRLTDTEARAVKRRLAALEDGAVTTLDFTGPLHPAWRLEHPERITRIGSAGRLGIEARPADGQLGSLPIDPTADHITIDTDIAIDRAEFSACIRVGLAQGTAPGGALLAGIQLAYAGGSGDVALEVTAVNHQGAHTLVRTASPRIVQRQPTAIRVAIDRAAGTAHIGWAGAERAVLPLGTTEPTPLHFTVQTHRLSGGAHGTMRASLGPIRIRGARPDPAHRTDDLVSGHRIEALRWLADGDAERALEALDRITGRPTPIERAAVFHALGRNAQVDEQIAIAFAGSQRPDAEVLIGGWLHSDPEAMIPRLVRTLGLADVQRLFLRTWSVPVRMNPDDVDGRLALAAMMAATASHPVDDRPEGLRMALGLWATQANAAATRGHVRRAERAFDRAFALADRMGEFDDPLFEDQLIGLMIARATLAAKQGQRDEAGRWLESALSCSAVPELIRDHIAATAVLTGVPVTTPDPLNRRMATGTRCPGQPALDTPTPPDRPAPR